MKTVLVNFEIAGGVLDALDGKSALMVGTGPTLKTLVDRSTVAALRMTPPEIPYGPALGTLTQLGYPPSDYPGVGPLAAAALRIPLDSGDIAFRATLCATDGRILLDAPARNLSADDSRQLVTAVNETLRHRLLTLHHGGGHRHVLVWRDGPVEIATISAVRSIGGPLALCALGDRAETLVKFVEDAAAILSEHAINRRRQDDGELPANCVWPWGPGPRASIPSFLARRELDATLVASNDLAIGVGVSAGLKTVSVPPTRLGDIAFSARRDATIDALGAGADCVAVHIECEPADAVDPDRLLSRLRSFDSVFLEPLLRRLAGSGFEGKFALIASPIGPWAKSGGAIVPFLVHDLKNNARPKLPFDERIGDESRDILDDGWRYIERVL